MVVMSLLLLLLFFATSNSLTYSQVKQPFDIGDYVVLDDTKGYEG